MLPAHTVGVCHGCPTWQMRELENMDLDPQRLRDEEYRAAVFTALMQAHEDAIRHYCVLRLGEGRGTK